jgi:uncharacterized protein (TIGR02594 family)
MKISARYNWLGQIEGLPKMVQEAIKLGKLDTTEYSGSKSNPEIMALAKESGVADIYVSDETAWCAVAHVALALRAGKVILFKNYDRLRAVSFTNFGTLVLVPMMGDTLVFKRNGGYHVGLYIGEDDTCFHTAGGNQSNQYNIIRIEKVRLLQARRPEYKIGIPSTVKRYFLDSMGVVSINEK